MICDIEIHKRPAWPGKLMGHLEGESISLRAGAVSEAQRDAETKAAAMEMEIVLAAMITGINTPELEFIGLQAVEGAGQS